jgi:hypothetical protein
VFFAVSVGGDCEPSQDKLDRGGLFDEELLPEDLIRRHDQLVDGVANLFSEKRNLKKKTCSKLLCDYVACLGPNMPSG